MTTSKAYVLRPEPIGARMFGTTTMASDWFSLCQGSGSRGRSKTPTEPKVEEAKGANLSKSYWYYRYSAPDIFPLDQSPDHCVKVVVPAQYRMFR